MAIFYTHRVDELAAGNWKAIQVEAAKYQRAVVEVREYDPEAEISDQQRKYWFAVPVKHYADWAGYDKRSAEREIKIRFADQWFIKIHLGARILLSIRDISIRDMNDVIEAVRAGLDDECDIPLWTTEPDPKFREHAQGE